MKRSPGEVVPDALQWLLPAGLDGPGASDVHRELRAALDRFELERVRARVRDVRVIPPARDVAGEGVEGLFGSRGDDDEVVDGDGRHLERRLFHAAHRSDGEKG